MQNETKRSGLNGNLPHTVEPQLPAVAEQTDQATTEVAGQPWIASLLQQSPTLAITFAGQGFLDLDAMAAISAESEGARRLLETAEEVLKHWISTPEARWGGSWDHGMELQEWLQKAETRPAMSYFLSCEVSQALIFLNQMMTYQWCFERGLSSLFEAGLVKSSTGHSQGIMPALLVAESKQGQVQPERFADYIRYFLWQGVAMARSYEQMLPHAGLADNSPMAAISGLTSEQLEGVLHKLSKHLPPTEKLCISLYNTRLRHVVSGSPKALQVLRSTLEMQAEKEQKRKKEGKQAGKPLEFTWEDLAVDGAYHSPYMQIGWELMTGFLANGQLDFSLTHDDLHLTVLSPASGVPYDANDSLMAQLVKNQFVEPVRWTKTLQTLEQNGHELLLDLGPGDGVARLSRSTLKGTGIDVVPLAISSGRDALFVQSEDERPSPLNYSDFLPQLRKDSEGQLHIDNAYTRATGHQPIILPGMTPTTVEVPLVAAAANAGYTSELAGGGQVTEEIFWLRMEELQEALEPGREVVFNALYLDPYLWNLHIRQKGLIQQARKAGYPICGLTISAGLPEVDEAVALLDSLVELDIWLNAFKPGTVKQVKQVVDIAKKAPHHTIFVHLEGGKAGGHHSWENLEDLLLDSYHLLRSQPNLVLCVGGGIGTEERAVELLNGSWSKAYGLPVMPVDAVFLGTLTMACLEAKTSPQVKQALVDAKGTDQWVFHGQVKGLMTSGKSQLNADIHYIENAAARCGRILDEVAGNEEAVLARRDEIIEALNATAKPFFGELEEMTYAAVVERMVALMAVGRHGRYEDGIWPDRSFRQRVFDFLQRAEARLHTQEEGSFVSSFQNPAELDEPQTVLEQFKATYPTATTTLLHPLDAQHFVYKICARPGKPVNFVPTIDSSVRRWYKADSLWQAHHDAYPAEQVLILPGPEAVAGLEKADEPVASMFDRFCGALIDNLEEPAEPNYRSAPGTSLPSGFWWDATPTQTTITVETPENGESWKSIFDGQTGAIAELFHARRIYTETGSLANPLQTLCKATSGNVWTLHRNENGELSKVEWQWKEESNEERVVVEFAEDNHLSLEVYIPSMPQTETTAPYRLLLEQVSQGEHLVFLLPQQTSRDAIRTFYHLALFGELLEPVALFETAEDSIRLPATQLQTYARITGGNAIEGLLPINMSFSAVWKALFRTLSCDELVGEIFHLVHLDNKVETFAGWPVKADEELSIRSRVTQLDDGANGRRVTTESHLLRGEELCATVTSSFFIRGSFGRTEFKFRAQEQLSQTTTLADDAALAFLQGHDWLQWNEGVELAAGDSLVWDVAINEAQPRQGKSNFVAQGSLTRGGKAIATVALDETSEAQTHPLRALLAVLSDGETTSKAVERKTLGRTRLHSPLCMDTFAEVSFDANPIHRSTLIARLSGLDAPLVQGMWTAAQLSHFLVNEVAGGKVRRLKTFGTDFLNPVFLNEELVLEAVRTGVSDGVLQVEATAYVLRGDEKIPAVRAQAEITPSRSAYLFPGQGIQQKGMGMAGFARSRAARQVWETADQFTRRNLGFSILNIVRENPKELMVRGELQVHPKGVLHLTQFTQVAMAVLAQAQISEMKERGVLLPDAIICGHSVGEYNAIAVTGILPLEAVVSIVYQRGRVMHSLVERDETGASNYRMAVIRPHYARMDHAQAEELVRTIREEEGMFVEIVNYNVKGRQYSVTGEIAGLQRLKETLQKHEIGTKPAYLEIPGIDVPFHSSRLIPGVPNFRESLQFHFPKQIDFPRLLGNYIPNLVPRPFSLEHAYVKEVAEYTKSEVLVDALVDFERWEDNPNDLARLLLIELLAWQFASPVRWIETQDLLMLPKEAGGLGVETLVEIGVGYQPTLANMARYTQRLFGPFAPQVAILNAEAEAEVVLMQDTDPEEEVVEVAVEAAPAEAAPAAVAAPVIAAPVAPVSAGPVEDRAMTVEQALKILLSVQARVKPEQIRDDETLDDLFGGVSSRRNQVLLDLGAEFNLGPLDGAHEKPLRELYAEVARRAGSYNFPGKYLKGAMDEMLKRVFGRVGLSRKDMEAHLQSQFGLGDGLSAAVFGQLLLETREGQSGRGGNLGELSAAPAKRGDGIEVLEKAATLLGSAWGIGIHKQSAGAAGGGAAVDAAVVNELRDEVLGAGGVLMDSMRQMAKRMGHEFDAEQEQIDYSEDLARLETMDEEHGEDYDSWLKPRFEQEKHVAFTSSWAWARRDVANFFFAASKNADEASTWLTKNPSLLLHQDAKRVQESAAWFAKQAETAGLTELATQLSSLSEGKAGNPPALTPSRPSLTLQDGGRWEYEELFEQPGGQAWMERLETDHSSSRLLMGANGDWNEDFFNMARAGLEAPMNFRGETALVTGASPGSIAIECVRHLLRGGARVVVTTTSYNPKRLRFYRELYQLEAAPGSELHVVPFNQASYRDVDALVHWMFSTVTEQDGANVRVLKRPFAPTVVLPFAAIKEQGTLNEHSGRSDAALRAMLTSVERLVTGIAGRYKQQGLLTLPCHVVLPLSPNHGAFGGDGVYAETKAALEVLLHKWHSEADAWAEAVTFCAARIGWVRGTGLMDANNPLAALLEERHGIQTYAASEMGYLLSVLCTEEARKASTKMPLNADLTGGMATFPNLREAVDQIREELDAQSRTGRQLLALEEAEKSQMQGGRGEAQTVQALPQWPTPLVQSAASSQAWPELPATLDLSRTVVIVGAGEIGPCGTSRTRFALEVSEELSAAAILELAWMTGMLRFEQDDRGGQWVDTESGDAVAEEDIAARYREAVRECVGIRFTEPELAGFDPKGIPVMTSIFLEQEFSFEVGSEEEAQSFVMAAPDKTRARFDADSDSWKVTCLEGREVRVPRKVRLERQVAGLIPRGFDFQRYGFSPEMVERIDRATLFNLLATVDAFLSAGLTPEELLQWLHPARVANTQGAGIGGMQSLHRLYVDPVLDDTRQNDTLQETLINVVAAYAVQSYVGSYGAMSHPVAACATAAVSLEEGFDKLLLDKADFVVAGGYDDIGLEGSIGFGDMNATANTDKMLKMGFEPHQMSRSNDVRRRGFVEAQGGGTFLMTRADQALEMGLPILGVVGYASSFGDGIHKSIPAPGLGALSCAMGGQNSPLARALKRYGLTTDDIALVSKHDTSTAANDPNENRLHNTIQDALGRTPGNPLFVISQKSLTGHPKGGAAAWQLIGLCQSMSEGIIPGNRNLDCVDGQMEEFQHLAFTDQTLYTGSSMRAGLVTSLGFGHVSGLALMIHPDAVLSQLTDEQRAAYEAKVSERERVRDLELVRSQMEVSPFFEVRGERRFPSADGTACQLREETEMLLDPNSRLNAQGQFITGSCKGA